MQCWHKQTADDGQTKYNRKAHEMVNPIQDTALELEEVQEHPCSGVSQGCLGFLIPGYILVILW